MDALELSNKVMHLLATLKEKTAFPFILVGGASLLLHGSQRITNDIDLIVHWNDWDEFSEVAKAILEETDESVNALTMKQ
jgi:predicted nucleotidyltransferase